MLNSDQKYQIFRLIQNADCPYEMGLLFYTKTQQKY